MIFRVGQKVVCVDVGPMMHRTTDRPASNWLTAGAIYTVRWVGEAPWEGDRILGAHIKLYEIVRGPEKNPLYTDYPFMGRRFRPVVERKTDISIFTAMLTGRRQTVSLGES